jgi:prepilin-type N-terminal cleavage/methylation domain-containing protein
MTRRAFTLVEVMVALVISGLVVTLAYATMQAGLETSGRLEVAQSGEEREIVARAIITRAIRHAVPGTIGDRPVFVLRNQPTGDALTFSTRGVGEPNGASAVWEISLDSNGDTVHFRGHAVDDPAQSFSAELPRVHAIDVRVMGRDVRDGWFEDWPFVDRSPVAVNIAFLDATSRMIGAPLVVRVGLQGNR